MRSIWLVPAVVVLSTGVLGVAPSAAEEKDGHATKITMEKLPAAVKAPLATFPS